MWYELVMKVESIEEFLKRGGKVSKSKAKPINLDQLLFNEGLMDKSDAEKVKQTMSEALQGGLEKMTVDDANRNAEELKK